MLTAAEPGKYTFSSRNSGCLVSDMAGMVSSSDYCTHALIASNALSMSIYNGDRLISVARRRF
jgi:hypothetical protein